jgi:murein tripeptide amidase MpaA
MKRTLLIITLFLFGLIQKGYAQKYHRIKANINQEKIDILYKNGFEADHFHLENGVFTAEVSDADVALFKKQNIKFQYLIKDLEKNLAKVNKAIDKQNAGKNLRTAATPANFALGSYGGFFTMTQLHNILDQMRVLYPNLVTAKTSIGTTVEGRPIYMLKISDNPDIDEPESELFLNAVHHAREPMSLSQLIYFMWHVLESYGTDPEITTLLNSTEMYIVPMVNPDGYQQNLNTNPNGGGMWRKNRKNNGNGTFGVDINRNYGFQWGYDNTGSSPTTSSDTYRGPSAFSEPETQAVRNFCNAHDFVASMDFHSFGNYCIYPYGYATTNSNPELPLFQQMGAYLTAENGFVYGNAVQTVNYTANGAGDDWKYGEQTTKNKIYSFTPEVGASTDGFYPAQSRIIPLCESTLQMNRKILKLSSKFAELTTTAPTSVTSLTGNIPFSVKNSSLRNPSYTVSVSSTSPYVLSLPGTQSFNNMTLFQTTSGLAAFTLSPTTPVGTPINFTLTLDNGHSPVTKTVTIIYDCATPSNLQSTAVTTSSATASWTAVAGATGYYFSYKTAASSTWSADSLVSVTSVGLSGLTQGTVYNWRVRTDVCNSYSTATFTTQLPCTNPASVSASAITSSGAAISWTAVAGAINYQVQYKLATSSTWLTATNANTTTSYSLTGLAANTLYDVQVRTNCTSGSSIYTSTQFATAIQTTTYCANKGNNVSFFWVDYFKLGTITRTSGADAGYYNGTASVTNLTRGTANTVSFSPGYTSTVYRVYWRVWIDYNKDGDFVDAGEQIVSQSTTGAGIYNANFTVPAAALTGQTRIRVSMKYGAYSTSCETFTYGEVEDYTVNIVTATSNKQELAGAKVSSEINNEEATLTDLQARIYPNPTSSELFIDFKNQSSKNMQISIMDAKGVERYKTLLTEDHNAYGIDVSNYVPAVYFLKLENGKKSKTLKFVKE